MAKIYQQTPEVYANTERVSLVSSFMCSLLLGEYAAIDTSDGAGMNLMDLTSQVELAPRLGPSGRAAVAGDCFPSTSALLWLVTYTPPALCRPPAHFGGHLVCDVLQSWADSAVDACAPGLRPKLGEVVPAHTILGPISSYMADRYGFDPSCQVVAWSGDNPNSVAGLGLRAPGDLGLSLGTSDTLMSITDAEESQPGIEGHFFVNPVSPTSHMSLLCYKNGSLAREAVAKRTAGGSFADFEALVQSTPAGNDGNIGFFINEAEIIPFIPITGTRLFDGQGKRVDSFPPAVEARAILEGQMMSM